MSGHTEIQMSDKLKEKNTQQLLWNIPASPSHSEENKTMSHIHTALCIALRWFLRPPALHCTALQGRHWASAEVGERFIIGIRCKQEKVDSRLENNGYSKSARAHTHNLKHQERVPIFWVTRQVQTIASTIQQSRQNSCRQHGDVWDLPLHGYTLKNESVRAVLNWVFYEEVVWRGAKVHTTGAGRDGSLLGYRDCSPGWFPYTESDVCVKICRIMMPAYQWVIKPKQRSFLTEYVCQLKGNSLQRCGENSDMASRVIVQQECLRGIHQAI